MLLSINNLHVNYGSFQALMGVSLDINEGEIIALLGSNGAGKSTTINTISGTNSPYSGNLYYKGTDITSVSVVDRVDLGIIQVPEGRRLFPYMTVMDNLLVGSYTKKARAKRAEQLEVCFSLFPKLYERKNQMAGTLSGGEQQMCAIARALMQCPQLLMLDEPSLGLAPVICEKIFESLVELNKKGLTILLVEQNVSVALHIANRGYVIENGRNVLTGGAHELLNNDEVKRAYLGI